MRSFVNTRNRIHNSIKSTKSSSTKDILGIDIDTYLKWIENQMTPEMNWRNIDIDHVKSISPFDVSNNEGLRETFKWKNTQPLLKQVPQQKGIKLNLLDYRLQFIEAYHFIQLNEEGLNQDFY